MNIEILDVLRCPLSGERLLFEDISPNLKGVESGWLVTKDGDYRYPVINGIPRFVPRSNYADNFGLQWNEFRKTQLDSYSGLPISSDRFWSATGWLPEDLKNQWVLDAGAGAGRFAEIALLAGAKVVALDYSSAVDACLANLKHHPNLHVIQGDIYMLPFAPEQFSFVYSLGVLQHTPDVAKAFASLPPMLIPGGNLCVDFYWKRFRTMAHSKYFFRPIARRISQQKLFELLKRLVPSLLLLSQTLAHTPLIGKVLKRLVPVADYSGTFGLTDQQLKEWALLDTFDMLAPVYDNPQTAKTIKSWFQQAGMDRIEIGHWSHLVGRAIKPLKFTSK